MIGTDAGGDERRRSGRCSHEIVRLTPADWQAHRALRLEMLQDAPAAFWGSFDEALRASADSWQRQLAAPSFVLHARRVPDSAAETVPGSAAETGSTTARPDGTITLQTVGYAPELPIAPDEAILTKIWVRPDARGHGVSRQLVHAAAHLAAQLGRPRLLLDVDDANTAAIRSYERMGFRATGVVSPREDADTRWVEYAAHASELR